MAVADGTYTIINAATVSGTPLCINADGATDGNCAKVWLFSLDQTDAQYVRIWTRPDGTRQLEFPATGKCIETFGYNVSQGANLSQFSDNDTQAQRWIAVDSGSDITYGGTSYDEYRIYLQSTYDSTKTNNWLIGFNFTTTPTATSDICLAAESDSVTNQLWIFVPANPVHTGTYMLRSATAPDCVCDVMGISQANGANVFLNADNGGNNQIWWIYEYDESGQCKIKATHSMQVMETSGAASEIHSGSNVCQAFENGENDQLWVLTPYSIKEWNGVTYPTYIVRNVAAQGSPLVLDADGAITVSSARNAPNIMVCSQNGGYNQQWLFTPAEMLDNSIPIPADLRLSYNSKSDGDIKLRANGVTSWYQNWLCDGTRYRARYRYRMRPISKTVDEWSAWLSVADGQASNNGWGDISNPNCIVSDSPRKRSPYAITLPAIDNVTYDYGEVQLEVRLCMSDWKGNSGLEAHGSSATQTMSLVWTPTLTINGYSFSPDGLSITYSSDYLRGGNTIRVNSIKNGSETICSGYQFSGQPSSGTVTIPISALSLAPNNGDSLTANITIVTDETDATASYTKPVSFASGYGLSVTPTYTYQDDYSMLISVPKHTFDECYLRFGSALEPCDVISDDGTTVTFKAYPALGSKFYTTLLCQTDTAWSCDTVNHDAIKGKWYVWNWNGDCAVVAVDEGDNPEQSDTYSPDSTDALTSAREYSVYRFGKSKTRDLTVKGSQLDGFCAYGDRASLDRLADAKHALFRNPIGERHHVAILGVSKPLKNIGWGNVTVTQKAETL